YFQRDPECCFDVHRSYSSAQIREQPLFQLIGLMAADAGIEPLIVVVFNERAASVQDARMLLFLLGHFPPEVSQLRLGQKQVREPKVDLRNEPFDLGESNQRIERLLGTHACFKCSLRNPRISMCFSESLIIESKRILKTPW